MLCHVAQLRHSQSGQTFHRPASGATSIGLQGNKRAVATHYTCCSEQSVDCRPMLYARQGARYAVLRSRQWRPSTRRQQSLLTLAIETSCDDTCVAILEKEDGTTHGTSAGHLKNQATLHFHEKITAANRGHGGVHPLEALESHSSNLSTLVQRSLHHLPEASSTTPPTYRLVQDDGTLKRKPDFISATRGPGMRSNLRVGLDTAKGLATAWQIPLIGVHHMQAHALTPRLVHALFLPQSNESTPTQPAMPFLTLLISGGHTMLVHSQALTSHTILANTLDTAIGDCLDKAGRSILPSALLSTLPETSYGKHLSTYAFPTESTFTTHPLPTTRQHEIHPFPNPYTWTLPHPLAHNQTAAFSFASLPSAITTILTRHPNMPEPERIHLARTTLSHAFTHLTSRLILSLKSLSSSPSSSSPPPSDAQPPLTTIVVSGGVASNLYLRYFLRSVLDARGYAHIKLIFPPVELCTDNAAMVAWAGMEMFEAGWRSSLTCDVKRRWGMGKGEDWGGSGSGSGSG